MNNKSIKTVWTLIKRGLYFEAETICNEKNITILDLLHFLEQE